jgi:hypothetical protein
MEFNGIPLHPLVVHAAVVLGPAAALTALVYAARPAWRWLLRWPMLLLAAAAAGSTLLAYLSGKELLEDRPFLLQGDPIRERVLLHQDRGEVLLWVALGFLVVAAVAAWALGGPSALASGRGARETAGSATAWAALALVVAGAVALLVMTFLTGDAGARAVWGS